MFLNLASGWIVKFRGASGMNQRKHITQGYLQTHPYRFLNYLLPCNNLALDVIF